MKVLHIIIIQILDGETVLLGEIVLQGEVLALLGEGLLDDIVDSADDEEVVDEDIDGNLYYMGVVLYTTSFYFFIEWNFI
ncbi:hypothetical protein IKN40_03880 [bacterium]|nr:hypothetical protein [bacterium]